MMRSAESAALRHVAVRVGRPAGGTPPADVPAEAELPTGLLLLPWAVRKLRGLIAHHSATVLHAWGPAAADMASLGTVGLQRVRWVACDLPPDWAPPTWGTSPWVRLEPGPPPSLGTAAAAPPVPATGGRVEWSFPPPRVQAQRPDRAAARAAMGIPADVPVVLCTAPLNEEADPLTAAWACSVAAQVHRTMWVLGLGHGPREGWFRELLDRGGVAQRSRPRPRAIDWAEAIAAADVVLHADRRPHAAPTAALRAALSAGLPAVVSGVAGPAASPLAMTIGGPDAAELCIPGDARDHARGLHRLLTESDVAAAKSRASTAAVSAWTDRDPATIYRGLA
jgi:hypothetical protein